MKIIKYGAYVSNGTLKQEFPRAECPEFLASKVPWFNLKSHCNYKQYSSFDVTYLLEAFLVKTNTSASLFSWLNQ